MIQSFPPVFQENAGCLILGSMPSVRSLADGFYYAHPRNAFWPLIAGVFEEAVPDGRPQKISLLTRHRIALWDSAAACEREGSLDSAIRSAQPNDIPGLLARCPGIRAVLFNGKTAQAMCLRFYPELAGSGSGLALRLLPSTSPANTMPFAQKFRIWREAVEEALYGSSEDYRQEAGRAGTDPR